MIISNFQLRYEGGTVRAEAQITWEDSNRPPLTFFVQTADSFKDSIWADPNSFLIGAVLAAWKDRESRILVKGTVCPVLVNNLQGVFMMLTSWYPREFGNPPIIEPQHLQAVLPKGNKALGLMSGGIDSLCLLRANKLHFPDGHPNCIKAVLSVAYNEHAVVNDTELRNAFDGRMSAIGGVAHEAGVDIIPAFTNSWWLNPDGYFFGQKSYSSQLSAISSFFSRGFSKGYIASSYDAAFTNKPWGSHPQLDGYYSSSHFQMVNSGTEMTRLRKVAVVADWPVAFNNIRVCQNDNTGGGNCGTCEKCIRTMLMLEALGKLSVCNAFPAQVISSELLWYLVRYKMLHSSDELHDEEKQYSYGMMIPYLEKRGRHDLAETLKEILNDLADEQKNAREPLRT